MPGELENSAPLAPAGRIVPPDWMEAESTRAVIKAVTSDGGEARFVGGCVREAVLGRAVKDIDIATDELPERVIALLEKAGIKAIPTGVAHGTVTAVIDEARFEITTLRLDVETDGRHAKVAFTDDWARDAARRDFTINAMFLSPDGKLFDPCRGLADLKEGRVRFVGDAHERIAEDVLRLLRYFRFFAEFDRPPPDARALAACKDLAGELAKLSGERVRAELMKLLTAPGAAAALEIMADEGILPHVLPEASTFARLSALCAIEDAAEAPGAAPDGLRRLACVLDVDGAGAKAVAARLRLSNADADRLKALAGRAEGLGPAADPKAVRRRLYRLGADIFRDLSLIEWAGAKAADADLPEAASDGYRAQLATADTWITPSLPVSGEDVLALGIDAGPEVGALLEEIEAWWLDQDFGPDREACLKKLKELAGRE
ncbi:MAG: CCA tRNA nucleotidyltransferase [Proteobacteria bacterium]|nr:CCA tRNA nucleotidyltransferase [Pseudomonadota bacterium]